VGLVVDGALVNVLKGRPFLVVSTKVFDVDFMATGFPLKRLQQAAAWPWKVFRSQKVAERTHFAVAAMWPCCDPLEV